MGQHGSPSPGKQEPGAAAISEIPANPFGWIFEATTLEGTGVFWPAHIRQASKSRLPLPASRPPSTSAFGSAIARANSHCWPNTVRLPPALTTTAATLTAWTELQAQSNVGFTTGDKLHMDITANITANTAASGTNTISVSMALSTAESLVTPGYSATPSGTPTVVLTPTGSTTMRLDWGAIAGASTYKVERSLNGTTWSTLSTGVWPRNYYGDSGLTASTLYYYRVTPEVAGTVSSVVSATTLATAAQPPTDISGLAQWIDVSKLSSTDGTAISTLPDLSGAGSDFACPLSNAPVYKTGIFGALPGLLVRLRLIPAIGGVQEGPALDITNNSRWRNNTWPS
jgi:hypothetical protein